MSKRKCKQCKQYVDEFIKVPAGTFCDVGHAIDFANAKNEASIRRQMEKARKEVKRKDKATKVEHNKTVKHWRKEADKAFQLFSRLRDRDEPCISCGKYDHELSYSTFKWQGGHYLSKGAKVLLLRYCEDNCNKQCAQCNVRLSGNVVLYRINLVKKIGIYRVELLESPHPLSHNWIWSDYKAVYDWYHGLNKIIKRELKQPGALII